MRATIILLFIFLVKNTFALEFHSESINKQIESTFLAEDFTLDRKKVKQFKAEIKKRRNELTNSIVTSEVLLDDKSEKKAKKKAKKETEIFTYNLILDYIRELKRLDSESEVRLIAQKIIDLDFAVKVSGRENIVSKSAKTVLEVIRERSVLKQTGPEGEASNLIDPHTGDYFSQTGLKELQTSDFDISTLEPHAQSSFWTNPGDISKIDIESNYMGQNKLYGDMDIKFPNHFGVFKKVRKTQSKPKIDILADIDGKEVKFKIKIGSEMHSEATAGALLSALGFHTDITKYQKDFKMLLPDGLTLRELKREWYSYFSGWDFDKYISEHGIGLDGNEYVVFREVLIETKPKDIVRVGPWAYGSNGHRSLREVRGLFLFNVWVANNDLKEFGNNKLALKEADDGFEVFKYQHDLGFAFGRISREKPSEYAWDIVKSTSNKKVKLNFWSFQPNSGFEHVTYSDSRWMIRKMAELTRDQIEKAVELGGWPKEVGMLLVEKMISRRNQLVSAFGLEEEVGLLEFDRHITTDNKILVDGNLIQTEFEGYTQDYGNEISSLLENVKESVLQHAAKAVILGTSNFDSIIIEPKDIGFDSSIITELELSIDRDITKNLEQTGRDDNFLVEDVLRVRIALGVGAILRGKVNYIKEYRLVYPVKTKLEGVVNNGFIVNALLPLHVRKAKMPDSYVLILKDSFEGTAELLVEDLSMPVAFGIESGQGFLSQTVISRKANSYTVYKDVSPYKVLYKTLYASLKILRIPVWWATDMSGVLGRQIYKVNLDEGSRESKLKALDQVLIYSDLYALDGLAVKTNLTDSYVLERSQLNFLNLFKRDYNRRVDKINEIIYEKNGDFNEELDTLQAVVDKKNEWSFLGDGEEKRRRYRLNGSKQADGTIKNPYLDVRFEINDFHTKTVELSEGYIPFINKAALDKNFIEFSPELHTRNDLWGHITVNVHMMYNKEALDKILITPINVFNELMAKRSDMSAELWGTKNNYKNYTGRVKEILRRYQQFIKHLTLAQQAVSESDMYIHLIDAIDHSIWRDTHSFDTVLLQTINNLVGVDNYYVKGIVSMPENKEMRLPAKAPLVNLRNKDLKKKLEFKEFDFDNAEEIWEVFH